MQFPFELQVGGQTWTFREQPTVKDDDGDKVYGYVDYEKGEVLICSKGGCQKNYAIWHEYIHLLDWTYLGDLLTEEQTAALAHGMLQTMGEFKLPGIGMEKVP